MKKFINYQEIGNNHKYFRFYLIYFLMYNLISLFMGIYSYYHNLRFGYQDDKLIFGYLGTILLGLFLFSFIFFNLYFLIKGFIKKYPKILLYLSLSENAFLFFLVLGLVTSMNINFSGSFMVPYLLKIVQLISIIYLLIKIKNNKSITT